MPPERKQNHQRLASPHFDIPSRPGASGHCSWHRPQSCGAGVLALWSNGHAPQGEPAGLGGVSPRESKRNSASSQRDAAGTRSRGRLRYKNSVKMRPVRATGAGHAPTRRFGKVQTGVDTSGANV